MALEAGTRLGNYEVLSSLGAGGMGEVYRARDLKLDRDVALKVLPKEVAEDQDRCERFEREAKVVASLNHPNIVTLHSIEVSDGLRHFDFPRSFVGKATCLRVVELIQNGTGRKRAVWGAGWDGWGWWRPCGTGGTG